jgi:hypothetical protein
MDEIQMWAERDISRLFFNTVPTDIDAFVPPLRDLQRPLLVKVGVLRPYGCFSVFIGGATSPLECPLQSREVKVAERQVGTVGSVIQALPTEAGNMVDRCCYRGGLVSSDTLVRPSQNCWYHRCTICVDITSGPYTSNRRLWMLAGHALFRCPVFNTALRRHRLRDEGRTFQNKRGRLPVDTEHSDTPPVLRGPRK